MTKEEFTEAFEEYRRIVLEGAMLVYQLKENQERAAELQVVLEKEVRKQRKGEDVCDIIDMMKVWDRDFGNDETDEQNVLAGDPERFWK